MMGYLRYLCALLLLTAVSVENNTSFAASTYKLERVTSVEAGGFYVFEQGGHVAINSVASSALQTTANYKTSKLTGTEVYVWELKNASKGFYISSRASSSSLIKNTSSSTSISLSSTGSVWAFNFQTDGTAVVQNKNNGDRFLGYTSATSYAYKAYATSNLRDYDHAIVVYRLVEESLLSDAGLSYVTTSYSAVLGEPFTSPALLNPNHLAVTYSSSDESVATVDSDGEVSILAAGVTTIKASFGGNETYAAGEAAYTLTVAAASHKVFFYVNGEQNGDPTTVAEGASIVFPEVAAEIFGKRFVGWTTAEIENQTDEVPTLVMAAIMGTADVAYYAVYANVASESTEQVTDELTQATTGISGNAYSAWSGKTDVSEAVYAGQSAGSGTGIQLRSNEKNSGIVTTKSGGSVKKVAIKWNSSTIDGRTLNVYGANTAYGSAASLYGTATQGTLLGTITYGTSTELNIGGDYAFVGLRSADGTLYINNILITWEHVVPGAYSGFCTTLSPVVSHDRGDVNGDGSVTIADVKALVEILLGKDTEQNHYDCDAADVNRDGVRSIADVTALVSLILAGE